MRPTAGQFVEPISPRCSIDFFNGIGGKLSFAAVRMDDSSVPNETVLSIFV